jgi:DUF4097 and DUF4098 domain-containing protein YvlB
MVAQDLATSIPRRNSRGWLVIGSLLAIAIVVVAAASTATEFADRRLPAAVATIHSPVRALDITIAGSVLIEPWSGIGARVTTVATDGVTSPSDDARLIAGTLHIDSSCGSSFFGDDHCSVNATIEVPATTNVAVTAENGDVTVHGITASLTLDCAQGNVTVVGARGRLDLRSDQGEVSASDLASESVTATSGQGDVTVAFVGAPGRVLAASAQGSVTVLLPRGATAYRVVASSAQGSVSTGSVHTDSTSRRIVTATSGQGDVAVRYGAS